MYFCIVIGSDNIMRFILWLRGLLIHQMKQDNNSAYSAMPYAIIKETVL